MRSSSFDAPPFSSGRGVKASVFSSHAGGVRGGPRQVAQRLYLRLVVQSDYVSSDLRFQARLPADRLGPVIVVSSYQRVVARLRVTWLQGSRDVRMKLPLTTSRMNHPSE